MGPELFGVVGPVPGRDVDIGALRSGKGRQVVGFPARIGHCRRGKSREAPVYGLDGLRRLLLKDIGGMVRVSEQPGALGAERRDLHDHLAVVVFPPATAPRERGIRNPLPQRAVFER